MKDTIIYKLNRRNITILLLILVLIFGSGILFIIFPSTFVSVIIRSELLVRIIGYALCIVSMPFLIGYLSLSLDGYALKISEQGIENNSSLTNVGIICWKDISQIRIKKLKKNNLILIEVRNEEKYCKTIKNPFKRINLSTYNKTYGTSFVIETKNVICSPEDLETILQNRLQS